jgi:tetratricopeptide (TPR) repeat protein
VEYVRRKIDPLQDLLVDASTALNSGNIDKAKAMFNQALTAYDRENGAALYGLALIAGKEDDGKTARKYFERAVKSASADPSVKVWAHIYMGRMDDIACDRPRALENYREAVKVGDDTRNAQSVAKDGLIKAFGDGCRP